MDHNILSSYTSLMLVTFAQVFPGTLTSGNITLRVHSITYQFRVSASTSYGQSPNEGELSSITSEATIFVAEQGSYIYFNASKV